MTEMEKAEILSEYVDRLNAGEDPDIYQYPAVIQGELEIARVVHRLGEQIWPRKKPAPPYSPGTYYGLAMRKNLR